MASVLQLLAAPQGKKSLFDSGNHVAREDPLDDLVKLKVEAPPEPEDDLKSLLTKLLTAFQDTLTDQGEIKVRDRQRSSPA